jgi:hypothetical protein
MLSLLTRTKKLQIVGSGVQKHRSMSYEQFRKLEKRPMAGIGIDNQLSLWDSLGKGKGIDRRNHNVVIPVHNEGWLLDVIELGVTFPLTLLQAMMAARWAALVCGVLGRSASCLHRCRRSQNAVPAAWLAGKGRKKR